MWLTFASGPFAGRPASDAGDCAIRLAAWARSGTGGRGSGERPGSLMPAAQCVRVNASTIAGSNWIPANFRSSAIAWSLVSGFMR